LALSLKKEGRKYTRAIIFSKYVDSFSRLFKYGLFCSLLNGVLAIHFIWLIVCKSAQNQHANHVGSKSTCKP